MSRSQQTTPHSAGLASQAGALLAAAAALLALSAGLRYFGLLGQTAFVWASITILATTALLAVALLQATLRRFRRRIAALTNAITLSARDGYRSPLPVGEDEELAPLGRAVDSLLEPLQARTIFDDQLSRFLASMNEALLVTDPGGKIVRANAAAGEMLDCPAEALIGRMIADMLDTSQAQGSAASGSKRSTPRESVFRKRDGSSVPVSYTVSEFRDPAGRMEGRVYAAQNIGERKRVEQRIRYLARIDPLTRMSNRMQFQHQLQQAIARAKRGRHRLAILYVDIDHFKDINDTFGHAAGDTSLEIFARRITETLPAEAIPGRLAGDEFAVLLRSPAQFDGLVGEIGDVADRLLKAVGRPFQVQGEEISITASAGIALYPKDGDNVIELLRNADAALYQAKKIGGNCFEFYSADMNTAAVERLMLKSKLRRAFERNELMLHYQPKYNLKTGRIESAEALIRWDLPERGLIFPADFIPLAEETNLILQIGDWVLNRVCEEYRQWQKTLPSPVRVSVNLSLRQLQQQRFLDRVQAVLRAHGVSPTSLELEITETTLMEDTARAIRILDALYGMGLHLAIDDFGTGYSSLSALQQFPIDTLKIDQSFVRDLPADRDDTAIVEAIIKMAHSLKMEVVAEGVESELQLEFLRSRGCDHAQGRLFGDPMTGEDFLQLLIAQAEGSGRYQALFA